MEKICKNCGFSANPADATFCGRCGTKLSVQDYKIISDGTSKIQPKRDTGFTEIVNNVQENVMLNETKKTVGRNDPCPCGSGKKYKNCHGRSVV